MKDFPVRLRMARTALGLSLGNLAERMNGVVTKQSLSRYEAGVMKPKADVLAALASTLQISVAYLEGHNIRLDVPMLRSSSKDTLSEKELTEMEAWLAFRAEQYLNAEKQLGLHVKFENPMRGEYVSCLEEAIEAADKLRERWHCGDGPIPSVLRLMERKGIKLIEAQLPDHVIGLSTWADEAHPLVLLDMRSEKTNRERLRFTAAHELAHLLLTFPTKGVDVERLCNQFASFFLFPRRTFFEEMGATSRQALSLEELIDLRALYGVSIAAQVHEAWDLKMISREHYDWWYNERIKKNLTEEGWGCYDFPETLGREKRILSVINNQYI